jgi:uncharacterized protein YqgC (DUF456 family)
MEYHWIALVGIVFSVLGGLCVAATSLGLPGSAMLLALAAFVELIDGLWLPRWQHTTFGWGLLAACVVLAFVGEGMERGALEAGARRGSASKAGTIGAVAGAIAGALLGLLVPLPVFGSLLLAILGTFAGALAGEVRGGGRAEADAAGPASWAAVGRIVGTVARLAVAVVIWAVLTIAALWP